MSKGQRYTGKVKFFSHDKGFGFIVPDENAVNGGSDVFVHVKTLEKGGIDTLKKDQAVSFELSEFNGKISAQFVRIA